MSAAEPSVREALASEIPTLVELVNDAYGRTETPSGWTSEDHILEGPRVQEADVRAIIDGEDGAMLLARSGEQLVGCVHVHQMGEGASEIGMLSVRPDRQAESLGRRILERAEAHAAFEQDAERAVLHVLMVREELIAWYRRRGYEPTGETKPFEPEAPQRSLIGDLAFAVLEKDLG